RGKSFTQRRVSQFIFAPFAWNSSSNPLQPVLSPVALRCKADHGPFERSRLCHAKEGRMFWSWLKALDRILGGEATRLSALRSGSVDVPAGGLSAVIAALGMIYGVCMGCFALFKVGGPAYLQMGAAAIKVPLLFFLTLLVTLPSLYVSNALVG